MPSVATMAMAVTFLAEQSRNPPPARLGFVDSYPLTDRMNGDCAGPVSRPSSM
ncbi:hypothetical protein Pan181_53290 [Aeoliella mucimassa]|uniref:Uncharacterized protein n=1 Tax=Aeoliella mucimassa TaxID=2527972 RepID=A0A518AWJ2_9BACT|nr:hypothetical protein Pan181_53290 [Aeoliella mucimassa]